MATNGSVKINELPLITLEHFSSNDCFVMLDDGSAKIMTRDVLQAWVQANLRGEKGDTGASGASGRDGRDGRDGTNGLNGLSAYQVAIQNGFVGTQQQWLTSLVGSRGATGDNGWSPVLAIETRGDDQVIKVADWQNGSGVKPPFPAYLGVSGYVEDINLAINIRGAQGEQGEQGLQGLAGQDGTDGIDGETVNSIVINNDGSIKLGFPTAESITSNVPPNRNGWATYKDSQYLAATPLAVATNQQVVIPNNKATLIEHLPVDVETFYNNTTQKLILADAVGFYSIRVRFKVGAVATAGFLNISFSKETTDVPFSQDIALRGDSTVQDVNINTTIYGDAAIVANGLSLRVKSYATAFSIYDIEFTIAKLI